MKSKRIAALIIAVFIMAGCSRQPSASASDKLAVVVTLFPQYDFVRQIAGDLVELYMLLPPGVESHAYEPSPADMIRIRNADLFIYTGEVMEAWAGRILQSVDIPVLDLSADFNLCVFDDDDEGEDDNDDHDRHEHDHVLDPHIWTDPRNAIAMVSAIADALCKADPDNADVYRRNAAAYILKLIALDERFESIVSSASRNKLVFGGRFPFYYFVQRYGLEYAAAYDSCSTEAEPSARRIAELMDLIVSEKIPAIYCEELVDPKIARLISEETGAELLLLHSCHNVTAEEFEGGITYLELMERNAVNLEKGLN